MALGENVAPLRADRLDHLKPLARKAARWVSDNGQALQRAEPAMPASLTGRRADNWRHLLALADAAGGGGGWSARARRAAEALGACGSAETAGIILLADIRAVLEERDTDRIRSEELAAALGAMVDRPWPEWGKTGKPITQRGIATLLEDFKIKPKGIRIGAETPRGYTFDQFEDAFRRYLPAQSATPQHARGFSHLADYQSATGAMGVADWIGAKSLNGQECCGVADRDGEDASSDEAAYRSAQDGGDDA
jgi:hypothetical protein